MEEEEAPEGTETESAPAGEAKGYPDSTPLADMTTEQQVAYWRDRSRQHEKAARIDPQKLAELRDKASRHDALELELGTTADKAAAQARSDAERALREQLQPQVISARLDAAAARAGVADTDLARAIEFVDMSKFLDSDGAVDADKVRAFVATIAPAVPEQQKRPAGPSSNGLGNTSGKPGDDRSVQSGRDLYRSRTRKS